MLWVCMSGVTPYVRLCVDVLVDDLSNQTQYPAHNIPNHDLAWLRGSQAVTDLPYPRQKLPGIPSLEFTHYTEKERSRGNSTWP